MALKTMIFIDGSWIFHNKAEIVNAFHDPDFKINYQSIPQLVSNHLASVSEKEIDIVRTCFFGSIPVNKPGFDPGAQEAFYDYLRKECHFETEIYEIDFKNQQGLSPQEKCVDIALASSMMHYASIPGAIDVTVLLAGDFDYMPVLRRVRAMGKRTLLAGLRRLGSIYPTSQKLLHSTDLFDFPHLFLEEHLDEIRLVKEKHNRKCLSCGTEELTDWSGPAFYCSDCRNKHRGTSELNSPYKE
ncbi:MAG: NYN domain-containing protein [Holophagae bacterium]|nr:NYN domain-containing protein [Holophagae bacterium]